MLALLLKTRRPQLAASTLVEMTTYVELLCRYLCRELLEDEESVPFKAGLVQLHHTPGSSLAAFCSSVFELLNPAACAHVVTHLPACTLSPPNSA